MPTHSSIPVYQPPSPLNPTGAVSKYELSPELANTAGTLWYPIKYCCSPGLTQLSPLSPNPSPGCNIAATTPALETPFGSTLWSSCCELGDVHVLHCDLPPQSMKLQGLICAAHVREIVDASASQIRKQSNLCALSGYQVIASAWFAAGRSWTPAGSFIWKVHWKLLLFSSFSILVHWKMTSGDWKLYLCKCPQNKGMEVVGIDAGDSSVSV